MILQIKRGNRVIAESADFSYSPSLQEVRKLTCEVVSVVPIEFKAYNSKSESEYDTVVYNGNTFILYQAPSGDNLNEAGKYKYSLLFYGKEVLLQNVAFLDIVSGTGGEINKIRYTHGGLFQFWGDAKQLAARIEANIQSYNASLGVGYTGIGTWTLNVDAEGELTEDMIDITDGTNLFEALKNFYDKFYLNYYFSTTANGGIITITDKTRPSVNWTFKQGDGGGAVKVSSSVDTSTPVITRIIPQGGSRNVPPEYKKDAKPADESRYCPYILLPNDSDGNIRYYIDSEYGLKNYGVRGKTISNTFSGIYPSIRGKKLGDLYPSGLPEWDTYKADGEPDPQSGKVAGEGASASTRIDKIIGSTPIKSDDSDSFFIYMTSPGFNLGYKVYEDGDSSDKINDNVQPQYKPHAMFDKYRDFESFDIYGTRAYYDQPVKVTATFSGKMLFSILPIGSDAVGKKVKINLRMVTNRVLGQASPLKEVVIGEEGATGMLEIPYDKIALVGYIEKGQNTTVTIRVEFTFDSDVPAGSCKIGFSEEMTCNIHFGNQDGSQDRFYYKYASVTDAVFSMRTGTYTGTEFKINKNGIIPLYGEVNGDTGETEEDVAMFNKGARYKISCYRTDSDNAKLPLYTDGKSPSIAAGTEFVILNIVMPESYVTMAENTLEKAALDYLSRYDHENRTVSLDISSGFVAEHPNLFIDFIEGNMLKVRDDGIGVFDFSDNGQIVDMQLQIQSLEIKYSKENMFPSYSCTIARRKILSFYERLAQENQTASTQNTTNVTLGGSGTGSGTGSGGGSSNITNADHAKSAYTLDDDTPVLNWFLSALNEDEAREVITFIKGIKIADRLINRIVKHDDIVESYTNEDIMSALRVMAEIKNSIENLKKIFLRKDMEDSTPFLLSLLGGTVVGKYIKIGNFIQGESGGYIGEDAHAELEELNLRKMVKSDDFKAGSLGTGFILKTDKETGRSYLEVDELFVRIRALFTELEIKKLTYAGGNWIFSAAGMTCERVEELEDVYRCYFPSMDAEKEVENEFRAGDQARCQEFNVKTGTSQNVSNRYYWRLVVSVGDNYIDLSKTDCDLGSDAPKAGDSIVQLGNRSDKSRQNAIIISAYGEGSPSFTQHKGINSYSLKGTEKTRISPETNILTGEFHFETGKNVKDEIDSAKNTANSANNVAISANKIAEEAKKNADLAKSESEKANSLLADIANDNKLTAQEKQETKKEWDIIVSEKPKNDASADKYGVSKSAYGNAYNALSGYITPLLTSLSTTSDIVGTDFRAKFKAYYDARTDLLNAISAKAKELVDAADNKIESVKTELSAVDGKITLAVKTAKEEAISSSKAYTNSEIKVVKDQIALKVDSTTFNALNQKVTEQGSQITLNKNNIEQKVNKSDFNALGTRVSNAETKITQNANEIQQRATKSTVDALTGRVTTAESKITQNANSISLKITASEATNIANSAVNNLQIGGRNYSRNTAKEKSYQNGAAGNLGYPTSGLKKGDNIVVSFEINVNIVNWTSGTKFLQFNYIYNYTAFYNFPQSDNKKGWLKRTAKLTIGNVYDSSTPTNETMVSEPYLRCDNASTELANNGSYIKVRKFKVEIGNKATDWSLAPEDTPTEESIKSSFTIDTGGISMLGKKLSLTGMVTFNSLASDAQGKINTAQSTANTAKSTADTAKSTADSANSKATSAQNTANTAKSTADAAKTAAANAQSRADAAYNKKIELAQLGTTVISGGFIKTSLIKADEIIVSKLSGATGTFRRLQAVDDSGNVKGTLSLDGDRLWYDGDQYQQGTKDGRSLRYYMSDAWVRGNFGARTRTTLLVQGSSGYFYPKGAKKDGVYKSFERGTTTTGQTYYKLPCYGTEGDYSGMPVELIVFNVISSNQHFYELQLDVTQKVNMINCNNNYTNILIYCNGQYPGLPGGSVHYAWNVLPFMNPQPTANVLGRGLLFGGSNDNDWR